MAALSVEDQPVNIDAAWKKGSGRVDHVAVAQPGDRGHVGAGAGEAALRAAHRLGQAGGARREDEHEQVVLGGGLAAGERLDAGQPVGVGRVVDEEDLVRGDRRRGTLEQPGQRGRGHEDLAVAVVDELRQLGTPVGRVDAHDDGPAEGCGHQPEQVVGGVVEQDPDVGRPVRVAQLVEQGGAPPTLVDDLPEGPRAVLVEEAGTVVVGPGEEQLGGGRHGCPATTARRATKPASVDDIDVNIENRDPRGNAAGRASGRRVMGVPGSGVRCRGDGCWRPRAAGVKAVVYDRYGPPEVLRVEDVPRPSPGPAAGARRGRLDVGQPVRLGVPARLPDVRPHRRAAPAGPPDARLRHRRAGRSRRRRGSPGSAWATRCTATTST